jgi:hypothetical protein
MPRAHRFIAHSLAVTSLFAMAASTSGCLDHPLKPVELEKSQEDTDQIQLTVNKDVDILFVIDNSGSMGEEQGNLASNFGAFISVLEDPLVDANYRLGVTTTDNGNVWCAQLGIGADSDPWLESIEGTTNLPEGVTATDAFQCLGPQGINGCGFESQLESMHKSFLRMKQVGPACDGDPTCGFMRDNALLAVVQVTDEADCSYNTAWTSIFEQTGNRVFWANPADPFPTSAVCWNAGTKCTGDPSAYDCTAQDYDVDGNELDPDAGDTEDNAVLWPLKRYRDYLQGIENNKKDITPGQEVIVALIGGVGDNGGASYAVTADTAFMSDFGIGAGCSAPVDGSTACTADADCAGVGNGVCSANGWCTENQTAIPPVRLAEFTDSFTENNKFTICSNDYTPALGSIATAIADQLKPACYAECVSDSDPTTSVLDPVCNVREQFSESDGSGGVNQINREMVECARDPSSGAYMLDPATMDYQMPNADTHVCFAMLVDTDGTATADPLDDMSSDCVDEFFNLEFKVAREPGFPAPGGTSVSATCALSDIPQADCPGLE